MSISNRLTKLLLPVSAITVFTIITLVTITETTYAGSSLEIYSDKLNSSWKNWSWGSSVNFTETNFKQSGSYSIKFDINKAWAALYLHSTSPINISDYDTLEVWIKGYKDDQKIQVILYGKDNIKVGSPFNINNYGGNISGSSWKKYSIPLEKISQESSILSGFAIQDAAGSDQWPIYVDSIYLTSGSSVLPTPTPVQTPTPTTTPSPITTPTPTPTPTPSTTPTVGQGFTTSGGKIQKNGTTIKLKGVSWFGFDGGTRVVHGLWARNYKDMISQIKSTGFNSVRVPFCPLVLRSASTTSINYTLNPDLNGLNSLQVLDKVVNELNNQSLYILLDHHNPDCTAISDLWYTSSYSEQTWINDLKMLSQRYKDLPYFLGLDIKNEPKGTATWGTGNTSTDWNLAAEKAGKEILAVNPNILIFVQGVQNNPTCTGNVGHFWGGNLEPLNCKGINESYIPKNKLVLSPHVYGPDVYNQPYFNVSTFPSNMSAIWDSHFGYLATKGYTVVPGEWGGKYGNGGLQSDIVWQDALVNYLIDRNICSSYYWDWNPNSTDTGGILKDDWKTVWSNKADMLNNYYNSCSN